MASSAEGDLTEAVRSATKWLTTAFAGIFGVLFTGLQLRDLNKAGLSGGRQLLGLASVSLALLASGWVIRAASQVLTAHCSTLSQLNQIRVSLAGIGQSPGCDVAVPPWLFEELMDAIDRNQGTLFLGPASGLADLEDDLRWHWEALTNFRRGDQWSLDAHGRRWLKSEVDVLEHTQEQLKESAGAIVGFANDVAVRCTYRRFRHTLFFGAIPIVFAVAILVFATSPPTSQASEITTPIPVRVVLTARGQADLTKALGGACVDKPIDAVAISGKFPRPLIVVQPSADCRAAVIELTERAGIAVPQPRTTSAP